MPRAILKVIFTFVNDPGIKVKLKSIFIYMKKRVSIHPGMNPGPLLYQFSMLFTKPQESSNERRQNHYLSHAYGKESFGTWGARPCTVPGVTEIQILRPYVLSKGSGNDPS